MLRGGAIVGLFAVIVLALASLWQAVPATPGAADAGVDAPALVQDTVAGGTHWRFETKGSGPVHVWIPPGYDPATAGIVIYVHGFYTNVDKSWNERGLAEQFAATKRNALFIVPEAPAYGSQRVHWNSPYDLIVSVRERTKVQRPWGPLIVLGHSGAHRTIRRWLSYRSLNHIILLDGMYGHAEKYMSWLAQPKSHHENRLMIIAIDTLPWSEPLWHTRKDMVAMDHVPTNLAEVPQSARNARLLYLRSQHTHMQLVLNKQTIPVLLQLTRLPRL